MQRLSYLRVLREGVLIAALGASSSVLSKSVLDRCPFSQSACDAKSTTLLHAQADAAYQNAISIADSSQREILQASDKSWDGLNASLCKYEVSRGQDSYASCFKKALAFRALELVEFVKDNHHGFQSLAQFWSSKYKLLRSWNGVEPEGVGDGQTVIPNEDMSSEDGPLCVDIQKAINRNGASGDHVLPGSLKGATWERVTSIRLVQTNPQTGKEEVSRIETPKSLLNPLQRDRLQYTGLRTRAANMDTTIG